MQTNVPQQIRKSMGRLVDSSYRACGQGAVRFLASLSRLGKYGGDRRDAVQSMGSKSGHVPGRFRSPGNVRSEEPQPVLFRRVLVHGMVTGRTLTAGGVPGCGLRGPTPSAGMPPPVLVATGEGAGGFGPLAFAPPWAHEWVCPAWCCYLPKLGGPNITKNL